MTREDRIIVLGALKGAAPYVSDTRDVETDYEARRIRTLVDAAIHIVEEEEAVA